MAIYRLEITIDPTDDTGVSLVVTRNANVIYDDRFDDVDTAAARGQFEVHADRVRRTAHL